LICPAMTQNEIAATQINSTDLAQTP